jgi:cytochrome c oxidase assembly protein subunit 17
MGPSSEKSGDSSVPVNKEGKKMCCVCPDTKRIRDECVLRDGEEQCQNEIEQHNACLRKEGFNV